MREKIPLAGRKHYSRGHLLCLYQYRNQEHAIVFNLDCEVAEEYLNGQQHLLTVVRASECHAVCNVRYWKRKLVSIAFRIGFPPFDLL